MLSPSQQEAANRFRAWLFTATKSRPFFYLAGYAGTGKTTIARALADELGGTTAFMAYTGKAASVMAAKGCAGATTIHASIYDPKEKSRQRLDELLLALGRLPMGHPDRMDLVNQIADEKIRLRRPAFMLKRDALKGIDLIVVDEVSMVGEREGTDLLALRKPVLVLGDPGQLPPVRGAGFFTNQPPDVTLTEIHRQAAESPVLKYATWARKGIEIPYGDEGNSRRVARGTTTLEEAMAFDQILVGMNRTRNAFNRRIRAARGYAEGIPSVGERLVCLRNNHDLGLLNGATYEVLECAMSDEGYYAFKVRSDNGDVIDGTAWRACLGSDFPDNFDWATRREHEEFDFGYALTVHKAQGSQWNRVLLVNEWGGSDREKWLYTGITRAAEQIVVSG